MFMIVTSHYDVYDIDYLGISHFDKNKEITSFTLKLEYE